MTQILFPTVIEVGTVVRLSSVDPFGFQGREHHPVQANIGFTGTVEAVVEQADPADCDSEEGDGGWVCYSVRGENGKVLELMDFELEVII